MLLSPLIIILPSFPEEMKLLPLSAHPLPLIGHLQNLSHVIHGAIPQFDSWAQKSWTIANTYGYVADFTLATILITKIAEIMEIISEERS